MASLTKKRNCKNWIACFTLPNGARTNRTTGTPNRKLAKRIAGEFEQASALARKRQLNETRAHKFISDMREIAGDEPLDAITTKSFLTEWAESKNSSGTKERYNGVVTNFLNCIGKKADALIANITYKDISKFIKKRQAEGLASKTVLVDAKILNTAFTLARKLGHSQINPVERALALKPLQSKSSVKKPFTPEQVASLVQHADNEWKTAIMLGYYTGARLEDCAKMQWDHIDFDKQLIDFVASKSGVRAVVPMNPQIAEHLEALASTDDPNPYLTPSLSDKRSGGKTGLSSTFKQIMDKAGIDPEEIQGKGKRKFSQLSFHSLRHAFNSLLANQGVDQETRMKLTGQKSKAVNKDYTHLDMDKLSSAMEKLPMLELH